MIDIYVGPTKKLFRVHKAIFCEKIPYFDKMFSGGFKDALEHSATFPEDSPEDFEVIYEWVYTGFLKPPEVITIVDGVAILPNYVDSTYAFADKFGLESLMDRIMTAHMKCEAQHGFLATFNAIEKGYNTTPVGIPLRKYFAWTPFFIIYEGDVQTLSRIGLQRISRRS